MLATTNFNDDYSKEYLTRLGQAINESKSFNFPSQVRISPLSHINDSDIDKISGILYRLLWPHLSHHIPDYWGNSCQELSSHIFGFLNAIGIDADIVIGEVQVHGTLEFDTELEMLRADYNSTDQNGDQRLHAWVSLGSDIIIDAGLPNRMQKYYRLPENIAPIAFFDRASNLSANFLVRHQPMIVGADFLAKTNKPNPFDMMKFYAEHVSHLMVS